jgi:hypothetical protein
MEPDKAEALLRELVALGDRDALRALARILAREKKHAEAAKLLARYADKRPSDECDARNELVTLYADAGDLALASAGVDVFARRCSDTRRYEVASKLMWLGALARAHRKIDLAIKCYSEAATAAGVDDQAPHVHKLYELGREARRRLDELRRLQKP